MPLYSEMSVAQRVKELVKLNHFTQSDLADLVGVTSATISGILSKETGDISSKYLTAICKAFPKISERWLLTGLGEIENTETTTQTPPPLTEKQMKATVTPVEAGQRPPDTIPLYDININAGNVQRLIEDNNSVPLVGWLHLEDVKFNAQLIGVRAKGDSMSSYINGGDVMLIRKIENKNIVNLGYPHVVITSEQSMVKYVRAGVKSDEWILRSHNNEKYQDFPIPKADVKHLFVVVKVLKDITY